MPILKLRHSATSKVKSFYGEMASRQVDAEEQV